MSHSSRNLFGRNPWLSFLSLFCWDQSGFNHEILWIDLSWWAVFESPVLLPWQQQIPSLACRWLVTEPRGLTSTLNEIRLTRPNRHTIDSKNWYRSVRYRSHTLENSELTGCSNCDLTIWPHVVTLTNQFSRKVNHFSRFIFKKIRSHLNSKT